MTDNLDADLGAAFDNANAGANVIDTSQGHIEPDRRSGNPSEHGDHIEEARARSDELSIELGKVYDREHGKQLAQEARTPKPPAGLNTHEAAAWAYDVSQAPKAEQNVIGLGQTRLSQMIEEAKALGVNVQLNPDGTIPADQLAAVMQLQPKPEGKPDTETLAGELKELLPTAKSQKEVAEAVRPYADFERDFRTRGAQAFVDAAAQRGVHLADLSNPQHRLHVAAEFYGQPDRVHQLVEQVVQQRVSEVVQQHVAQAVEQVQQANVQEAMAQVARGRSDFDELRQSMAEIIQSPRWRERDGEFTADALRRAYDIARRERARRGPGKSRMDRDLDTIADRHYSEVA